MTLTVEGLIDAILSAKRLEQLQADLRNAMIEQLVADRPTPTAIPTSGALGS